MEPREIFLGALKREATARPAKGSATSVVTVDLMDKVGAHFPEAHLDEEKMARLASAGHTQIGFDNVMPLFGVCTESAALGVEVDWGQVDVMPTCRRPLYGIEDEVVIPENLLTRPSCRAALRALELLKKWHGEEVALVGKVFGPWTLGYHVFGVEEFLVNTLLKPDAVKHAMATLKEVTVRFGLAQLEAGADALCLADHATRDVCSPGAYDAFLFEIHQEMVERLPCPLILHICGDTSDRIPRIRETGLDCFHFDSKVPAAVARERAGEALALMGGTSNLEVIRKGTPERIRQDVRDKVEHAVDIIGPECAVPLDSPFQNMKTLADEVEAYSDVRP
ncbi:MAG: MtaA/CmuA family methyltransferase [Armatimonadota bacterium]|nr:MAG: MtaA/CmuA family methyltransferase [Armatimonadota bacterium]